MSGNTFGQIFQVHTFGESHGQALGCVIDGCPAGVIWDQEIMDQELARRRPGQKNSVQSEVVTQRQEPDTVEILSGVFGKKTLGTPIAMIVRNEDAQSQDYETIKNQPRTGHADDVWSKKFGHVDHRGGGRASGRETVSRVLAGAVAQMALLQLAPQLQIFGFTREAGPFKLSEQDLNKIENHPQAKKEIDQFVGRFPSQQASQLETLLQEAREGGESYGGLARIVVKGLPAGLGQPVFHKLKADLAQALMSVGATSGLSIGEWTKSFETKGTEFHSGETSDNYGGQRGGISTGENLMIEVAFKPTSSILETAKKGRHDPFILTRAIPVLEAMTAIVILDHFLLARVDKI